MKTDGLSEITGYRFKNPAYLEAALTRTAYARENCIEMENTMDALAVLGDAVLDLLTIESIIAEGEYDKGEITRRKIDRVNMSVFRRIAEEIGLPEYVNWGKGELRMQIWTSGRVSAECFEAYCGAVYKDGGLEALREVLERINT
ncbi:MAG TPA: ribonuclease III [Methanocorpusculum sp.]|nr:ribonuclease III [Methanocorpusculum sp.]